jgi:hypothetical protein
MIITLTRNDPDESPITFFVEKIVCFFPDMGFVVQSGGWFKPRTRIFDVTDSGDSNGTGVMEDYATVKKIIEIAIAGK